MFALGHPEKIVDFAYRAMHEMTAASKTIIQQFYGRPQQYSYYKGCSTGGRQGAMNAQRYPEDFDGIIAGAGESSYQMHTAVARKHRAARHRRPDFARDRASGDASRPSRKRHAEEGFLTNRAHTFDFRTRLPRPPHRVVRTRRS
jgi:hypothetical protein